MPCEGQDRGCVEEPRDEKRLKMDERRQMKGRGKQKGVGMEGRCRWGRWSRLRSLRRTNDRKQEAESGGETGVGGGG